MIISHTNKYLFVELPRTGTTAISHELLENYDAVPILQKHAMYGDFLKIATPKEKKYFVFLSVRNPLDRIVSLYFKYQSNHRGQYTNAKYLNQENLFIRIMIKNHFSFVYDNQASFPEFFKMFYRVPFDDWTVLARKHFNFVIHFENINEDFTRVLERLNIDMVRPLPVVNKTSLRAEEFWSYYTPEIRDRAKWVFGPYLKRWGYEFPPDWGDCSSQWSSRAVLSLVNAPRKLYWKYYR